jgi:hypothetical protein
MRPFLTPLRAYTRDARDAFAYAPLEVLVGIAVAICASVAVRQEHGEQWWLRVLSGAVLAMPLLFSLSALRARGAISAGLRWAGALAVLAAVALYAAFVFHPEQDATVWRTAMLMGATVCAASLVPIVGTPPSEQVREHLWSYNTRLLVRIVVVGAYGVALFAALAGAVAAVSSLFELKTPEHLYTDLAGAVFFALVPWVVVGGIPALIAPPEPLEGRAPAAVRLLGRYLYALVLGIYLAILAAYTLKVLVTWELPRNLLSPIVLFAGLAGFLGALFLEPLYRDAESRGIARFMRAFPLVLLAMLPLAMYAVWVRRAQYGWTESRYLRLALLDALLVLALSGSVRLFKRRPPLWTAVPLVLGVTLLITAVGPWGASAVSRRNQQARLKEALAEAHLLTGPGGTLPVVFDTTKIAPARQDTIPAPLYDRITGGVTYLYGSHGADALAPLIPNAARFSSRWQLVSALPLARGCEPRDSTQPGFLHLQGSSVVANLPAGTLHDFSAVVPASGLVAARPVAERAPGAGDSTLVVTANADGLTVEGRGAGGEWRSEVALGALLARGEAARGQTCERAPRMESAALAPEEARFTLTDAAGRGRGVLILRSAGLAWPADTARAPKRVSLERADGFVVVEAKP